MLVRTLAPAMVLGGASADLAHLLAELIENGLRHPASASWSRCRVVGPEGYTITIVDHGLGMTPDEIERQPAPGRRRVGHRHPRPLPGALRDGRAGGSHGVRSACGSVVVGIAAVVELPATLITEQPGEALTASPVPVPPRHPRRPARPPGGSTTSSS